MEKLLTGSLPPSKDAWWTDDLIEHLIDVEGYKSGSYNSHEEGNDTVGIGHKLTDTEAKTEIIMLNGQKLMWRNGIREEDAIALAKQDAIEVFKKMRVNPENLDSTQATYLLNMGFIQGESLRVETPKFLAAVLDKEYEEALRQTQDVHYTVPSTEERKGYGDRWKDLASATDTQAQYKAADANRLDTPTNYWRTTMPTKRQTEERYTEEKHGVHTQSTPRKDFAQYNREYGEAYAAATEEEKNIFQSIFPSFDKWKLNKPAPVSRYTELTGGVHTQTPKTFAQYTVEKNQAYADSNDKNNFNYLPFDDWKNDLPPSGLPLAPETSGEPEGDRFNMNIPNLVKERQGNKTKVAGEVQLAALMEQEGEDFDLFGWLYKTAKEKLIDPVSDLGQKVLGVLEGGAQNGLDVLEELFDQDSAPYQYGLRGGPKGKGAIKNSPRVMSLDNMSPQEMSKIQMRMQAEAPNKQDDDDFLLAQYDLEARINEQ